MSRSYAYPPRLMKEPEAARYIGQSESTLRMLGLPRKVRGANRLYDIRDLDAYADSLQYEGNTECEINPADSVFGIVRT